MQDAVTPLSEPEAIDLVKTCFASATERDIYTVSFIAYLVLLASPSSLGSLLKTLFVKCHGCFLQGDKVEIVVLNADGIRHEYMDLRKD